MASEHWCTAAAQASWSQSMMGMCTHSTCDTVMSRMWHEIVQCSWLARRVTRAAFEKLQ